MTPMTTRQFPLRVAVLTSRRAPGLDQLIARSRIDGSYSVEVVVSSDSSCVSRDMVGAAGVPYLEHDLRAFCAERGKRLTDMVVRAGYDAVTVELLEPHGIDVVVCCGYLNVLTEPMLAAYPARIVNIHDADLAVSDVDGVPRYRGLRSTRDAIRAGERVTRSTVHLVTSDLDAGPILARSAPFPVHEMVADALEWGAQDLISAYAYAQREWMMRTCWGELLHGTLVSWPAAASASPSTCAQRSHLLEVA
jgi:phosphoribosylglycinamide formyltransferase 1